MATLTTHVQRSLYFGHHYLRMYPHSLQNFEPLLFILPHFPQLLEDSFCIGTNVVPHAPQKRNQLDVCTVPSFGHPEEK
jgi:hypothetical protein